MRAIRAWFGEAELLAGLSLALAVVAVVAAERLKVARDVLARTGEPAPAGFEALEWVVLAGGVVAGGAVLVFRLDG
jgi:hypothetical protein